MTELVLPGVTTAQVNWGRWVAFCSYRHRCDASILLTGAEAGFRCPECGGDHDIVWPSAVMMYGIARLLLMRPHPKNQNWVPPETLHDLLQDNAMHGILTQHAVGLEFDGRAAPLIGIDGDRITTDMLPTLNPRRELVR